MLKMMTKLSPKFDDINKYRNALSWAFSAIVSIVFSLLIFTSSNPIWGKSGVDSASFILIGQGMNKGLIPYINFVDNKGLVLYVINAIPQYIFKSTVGIWIVEVLFLFLSLRTIDALVKNLNSKSSFMLQILYLISISSLVKNGNMGEEYSSLFVLLAFLLYHPRPENLSTYTLVIKNISIGALFALSFFIRPNNALPIFAIFISSSVFAVIRRKYFQFLLNSMSYLLGFLLILTPILIYLQINNALMECLNQTFLANLKYSGDSGNSPIDLLTSIYGIKTIFIFILSSLGVFAGYFKSKMYRHLRPFVFSLALAVLLSLYSSFISGFAFAHYLLINTAPMIITMIILLSYFEDIKEINHPNTYGFVAAEQVLTYMKFEKMRLFSVFLAFTLMFLISTDKLQLAANANIVF